MEKSGHTENTENMNPHHNDLQSAVAGLREENDELLKKIEAFSNVTNVLSYKNKLSLLDYKQLEKKLKKSTEKLQESERKHKEIKRSLAFRLGSVVIDCWQKPLRKLPLLPFFLISEYLSHKKNKEHHENTASTQEISTCNSEIYKLYAKAMGGYSRYAIPELEEYWTAGDVPQKSKNYAAFLLGQWHIIKGNYDAAYAYILQGNEASNKPENWLRKKCLEHICLYHLGRHEEAMAMLEEAMLAKGRTPDLLLMYASHIRPAMKDAEQDVQEARRLTILNEVLAHYHLLPIAKKDSSRPLGLSNIMPEERYDAECEGETVSVIMPVYNAEKNLAYAIEGILAQTWQKLELIAVDDASTDGSLQLLHRLASSDPRIKVVHLEKNAGAYSARNKGLEYASGEYITVHDSDDWSHPQKLELQVQALKSSMAVASVSHLLRVNSHIEYTGFFTNRFKQENMSSLMFKREVIAFMGGWQQVRASGDAEFLKRIKLLYGDRSVVTVKDSPVLSLCLHEESSLTSSSLSSIFSLFQFSGLRNVHRSWYSYLHDSFNISKNDPSTFFFQTPFPPANRFDRKENLAYDLIVISDFTLPGGSMRSSMYYALAAKEAGFRVAIYHWKKYTHNPKPAINPHVFSVVTTHGIDLLSASDTVSTKLLLVGFPSVLSHTPDSPPKISTRQAAVLVNQMASSLVDGELEYDPVSARKTMQELFGLEGTWIPISGWVKRLMQEDPRYPEPWHEPWHPLMDIQSSAETLPRKCRKTLPVIGRHGRDSSTKWPAVKEHLEQAYCVGNDVETLFMGGADWAFKVLDYVPEQWQVLEFGALPSADFLEKLDFLVHFPHELYIEEFGRVVMEAMAAGVVAVLPQRFKDTFGDAALYCESEEVFSLVQRYWQDQEGYRAQQLKAFAFVSASCDLSCFLPRLTRLLSSEHAANNKEE